MPARRDERRRADFPEVASRVIALFQKMRPPEDVGYHLTPHELRLLRMLNEGHSYKSAAAALHSSVNTVKFHTRSIYAKLQVHSKSEPVAKALRSRVNDHVSSFLHEHAERADDEGAGNAARGITAIMAGCLDVLSTFRKMSTKPNHPLHILMAP